MAYDLIQKTFCPNQFYCGTASHVILPLVFKHDTAQSMPWKKEKEGISAAAIQTVGKHIMQ